MLGLPALIGIIPDNQDPELLRLPPAPGDFWQTVRELVEHGWGVALHGYQHRYVTRNGGKLQLNRQSEFAGLSFGEQADKLSRGLEILASNGLATDVFMAPSHSYDDVTLEACRAVGIRKITDGNALFPYEEGGLVFVPQLFAFPPSLPIGVYTTCVHLNAISEDGLSRFQQFVKRRQASIVSFETAASWVASTPLNRWLGASTAMLLAVRRARGRERNA
jgi:hypothetical protein